MSRLFYHVMQDNVGNLLFNVTGTMRLAGTGTLATIYGDEGLTVILPNPMTNHPSFGSFKCFLGAGDYDFYMAKAGYTFETLTGVQGHGTMAQQNASAVVITGGHAVLATVGIGGPADYESVCTLRYYRDNFHGLMVIPTGAEGATHSALLFYNTSFGVVGSIYTNATVTAYNTSSDARLKDDVQPLTGALDVIRALNPVTFRWRLDGAPGRGLLAQEVQDVIPDGVITGERDAVDEEGNVQPQMIDYSKLVPHLVAAVKELTQQVEMLTAKLAGA